MKGTRVLVVEDHGVIGQSIESALSTEGCDVVWMTRGDLALHYVRSHRVDLVVLDLMLPGLDGREILRNIRDGASGAAALPVIVVSARDAVDERIEGLALGADDYLVKPFSLSELIARVKALLRRVQLSRNGEVANKANGSNDIDGATHESSVRGALQLRVGELIVDRLHRVAHRSARPLELTSREFDLLVFLAQNADTVLSRERLMREVWQVQSRATPIDNLIAVHMAKLRKEVDREHQSPLIHTIRGVGYMMSATPPDWLRA